MGISLHKQDRPDMAPPALKTPRYVCEPVDRHHFVFSRVQLVAGWQEMLTYRLADVGDVGPILIQLWTTVSTAAAANM